MIELLFWMVLYAIVVAASIIFIGKPIEGSVDIKSLLRLLLDWRFLFGGVLALGARFIFVIINNLASRHPALSRAHLTVAALATMGSVVAIILANAIFLGERLTPVQIVGAGTIIFGIFIVFR